MEFLSFIRRAYDSAFRALDYTNEMARYSASHEEYLAINVCMSIAQSPLQLQRSRYQKFVDEVLRFSQDDDVFYCHIVMNLKNIPLACYPIYAKVTNERNLFNGSNMNRCLMNVRLDHTIVNEILETGVYRDQSSETVREFTDIYVLSALTINEDFLDVDFERYLSDTKYASQYKYIFTQDYEKAREIERGALFPSGIYAHIHDIEGWKFFFTDNQRVDDVTLITFITEAIFCMDVAKSIAVLDSKQHKNFAMIFQEIILSQKYDKSRFDDFKKYVKQILDYRGANRIVMNDEVVFPYWVFRMYEPPRLIEGEQIPVPVECMSCMDDIHNPEDVWKCPFCTYVSKKECMEKWLMSSGLSTCPHCKRRVWE